MYIPALILLPGILFLSILAPLSAYFAGLHRPAVNVRVALAGFFVMLAGDILFIPRYGLPAAAAVSSAAYFACVLYSLLEFGRIHRLRPVSLLIIKKEDWRWLRRQSGNINI
jgi:O-antigen/teichoic acid export membrane protein